MTFDEPNQQDACPCCMEYEKERLEQQAEIEKLTDTVLKCRAEMGKRNAEIEKLQGFINTQRENLGVQDAEITRLQGWEKELGDMTIERDEAREAARMCYARIKPSDIPGMPKGAYDEWCNALLQRHPWLEEDQ